MSQMGSVALVLFISAFAIVLIVIGIFGFINTGSSDINTGSSDINAVSSDSFENSTVEFPSRWENLNSTNKTFLQYGYDRKFICIIQIINKDEYYSTIAQGNGNPKLH